MICEQTFLRVEITHLPSCMFVDGHYREFHPGLLSCECVKLVQLFFYNQELSLLELCMKISIVSYECDSMF